MQIFVFLTRIGMILNVWRHLLHFRSEDSHLDVLPLYRVVLLLPRGGRGVVARAAFVGSLLCSKAFGYVIPRFLDVAAGIRDLLPNFIQ